MKYLSINPSPARKMLLRMLKTRYTANLRTGLMADKAKAEAQVRKNIDYDEFAEWITLFGKEYMSVSELNKIVRIIVKGICSKLPRQTIWEEEYTRQNFDVRYRDSYLFSVLFNQAYSKEFTRNDEARAIDYDIKTTFGGI